MKARKILSLILVCIYISSALPVSFASEALLSETTNTETPASEPTVTPTQEPTASPTSESAATGTNEPSITPQRFAQGTNYVVKINCKPAIDGAGESVAAEAVVVLQRKNGDHWEKLDNPKRSGEDYTVSVMIASDGNGAAKFDISGFLADDAYRARLVSYAGKSVNSSDNGYSVAYSQSGQNGLATQITIRLEAATEPSETPTSSPSDEPSYTPSAPPSETPTASPSDEPSDTPSAPPSETPTTSPSDEPSDTPSDTPSAPPSETPTASPSDEPTAIPTPTSSLPSDAPSTTQALPELYTSNDFYRFSVSFDTMPEKHDITVALLDADNNTLVTQTLTLQSEPSVSAFLPLEGLPVQGAYTARVIELNGMSVSDAQEDGMTISYENDALSTRASVTTLRRAPMVYALRASPMRASASETKKWTLSLQQFINNTAEPIDITITLINSPESDVLDCAASSAKAQVTQTTTADMATLTVTPNGLTGCTYTINIRFDGTCDVTQSIDADQYALIAGAALQQGDLDEAFSPSYRITKLMSYTGSILWNDNNASADVRKEPTVSLRRYTSTTEWETLLLTPSVDKSLYNVWHYEYTHLLTCADNGSPYTYHLHEDADTLADYIVENNDSDAIRNTLKTSLTVTKQWNDAGDKSHRPNWETWLRGVKINGGNISPNYQVDYIENDNTWTVTITNLPAYKSGGAPATYYVTDTVTSDNNPSSETADDISYVSTYANVGEYAGKTDRAYQNGKLISTITAQDEFIFIKQWKDGATTPELRPNTTFYLYRLTQNDDGDIGTLSIANASPVRGMDNMTLTDKTDGAEITYTVDRKTSLPRFDETGHKYVYFLTEKIPANTRDYVADVNNDGLEYGQAADMANYILNGGTAINQSKATVEPTATKEWRAKAVQGMNASVTMRLYRVSDNPNTSSVPVAVPTADLIMDGFTSERMQQTMVFDAQEMYDDDGYQYTYTTKEISATVNGSTATPDEEDTFAEDDVFTVSGHKFRVNYQADGSVTNTLTGETRLRVCKIWLPEAPTVPASIQIRLLRDGLVYRAYADDHVTYTQDGVTKTDITTDVDGNITLTGTGNFEGVFANLPLYDSTGREYTYTLEETSNIITVGADEYHLTGIGYSMAQDALSGESVKTATITNAKPGEDRHVTFNVTKHWEDDNDLMHRVPIKIAITYTDPLDSNNKTEMGVVTLSADNSWHTLASYLIEEPIENDPRLVASHYSAQEISYTASSSGGAWMTVTQTDEGIRAKTQEHWYAVTVVQNGFNIAVTNRRIGQLDVVVSKEWLVGDMRGLIAQFQLVKNGADVSDDDNGVKTMPQTLPVDTITYAGLEKYDDKGAVIHYEVRETGLMYQGDGHSWELLENGVFTLTDPLDSNVTYPIKSTLTGTQYDIGENQHTGDTMTYQIENFASNAGSYMSTRCGAMRAKARIAPILR